MSAPLPRFHLDLRLRTRIRRRARASRLGEATRRGVEEETGGRIGTYHVDSIFPTTIPISPVQRHPHDRKGLASVCPSNRALERVQEPERAKGASADLTAGSLQVAKQCVRCQAHRADMVGPSNIATGARYAPCAPHRSVRGGYVRSGCATATPQMTIASRCRNRIHGHALRVEIYFPFWAGLFRIT